MSGFRQWLEANNISVVSYDKTGRITFSANGKKYTYIMDAGYFFNGFFKNWIKYAPGKAFNFARQVGDRADLPPRPKPDKVQKRLF